jgi:hypothetical protein
LESLGVVLPDAGLEAQEVVAVIILDAGGIVAVVRIIIAIWSRHNTLIPSWKELA